MTQQETMRATTDGSRDVAVDVEGPTSAATVGTAAKRRGPSGRDGLALGIGRAAEQGAYGLVMLVLAARMEVAAYGPIAVLFVVNSVALTLADLGVAHDLLRTQPSAPYSLRAVRLQRGANTTAAVVSVAAGALLGGELGLLIGLSGLLWASAGELYLRQAAALRAGRIRAHVTVDGLGGLGLVAAVVLFATPGRELLVSGAALVAHHLLGALGLPLRVGTLSRSAPPARPFGFLANQSLGYGTRNVDYFLAGPMLGPAAFSAYLLGYRVANAPSAPLGAVVMRWGLARLGSEDADDRATTHRRATLALFLLGAAALVATLLMSALLPLLIGDRWRGAAAVAAVTAFALPWRIIDGLIGAVGFTANASALLVRFEAGRLALTAAALTVGAAWGLVGFVVASVIAAVLNVTAGHVLAARAARLEPCWWLVAAAVPASLAVLVLAPTWLGDALRSV